MILVGQPKCQTTINVFWDNEYMASEIIKSKIIDYKTDICSLGVLLYEIAKGINAISWSIIYGEIHKILPRIWTW